MGDIRWFASVLMLASCDPGNTAETAVNAGAPIVATSEPGAPRSAELPDPMALAELMDRVPSAQRLGPTGPDGGTLIGSDSGVEGDELPEVPPAASHGRLRVGRPDFQPLVSNAAIERAARAQIYWHLRKCTTPTGEQPPAESIVLSFRLRPDGSADPATVSAEAENAKLDSVAECVERTFAGIAFRGPAASLGTSPRVIIAWPSVD